MPLVQVLKRDGYTCVATGYVHLGHPVIKQGFIIPGPEPFVVHLECAHILRRALGVFEGMPQNSNDPSVRIMLSCKK